MVMGSKSGVSISVFTVFLLTPFDFNGIGMGLVVK
jgi:hypothetical protein